MWHSTVVISWVPVVTMAETIYMPILHSIILRLTFLKRGSSAFEEDGGKEHIVPYAYTIALR